MPFIKIEKLLPKSVKKAGIKKQLDSAKILADFGEIGSQVFGPEAIKKIKPLYIKDGTLTITCLSSVLAQKLKAQEKRLIWELNRPYHRKIIERLRFLV
jgi:hypothetical protein